MKQLEAQGHLKHEKRGVKHQETKTGKNSSLKMKWQKSNHPVWDSRLSGFS
jgi:hypothetical protein